MRSKAGTEVATVVIWIIYTEKIKIEYSYMTTKHVNGWHKKYEVTYCIDMALINLFSSHHMSSEGIQDHLQSLLHNGRNYAS